MATISTFTQTGNVNTGLEFTSGDAQPDDTVELSGLPHGLTKCKLGVQMLDSGGDPILDTAGTFTVSFKTKQTLQYETPTGSPIDATAPATLSWDQNTIGIKVVPASLSATDHWRVVLIASKS